jgi:unsaturated chondroitin disaccharide hydrolase
MQAQPRLTLAWVDAQLSYCSSQIARTLAALPNDSVLPRSINAGDSCWHTTNVYDWTSGFWPGILWYNYEHTRRLSDELQAISYTERQRPLVSSHHQPDHDIGFQLVCSYGHAYRHTDRADYVQVLLDGAHKLAALYNPRVGTILSWPHAVKDQGWPHNTIMDNMMNLQLLFFAASHGGPTAYRDMAVSHARQTMHHQFRPDYTSYHVALYDSITGAFIRGCTNQGLNDDSFWARGQAWGIYGFTVVYRETGDKTFLRFVEKITDVYLQRLPTDMIPYWDFDDPSIPDATRDASAAAIVAAALIELSQLEDSPTKGDAYLQAAEAMLRSLSSEHYQSRQHNSAFLLHNTGNLPAGYEIDASINYADYYYIEALTRYRQLVLKPQKEK